MHIIPDLLARINGILVTEISQLADSLYAQNFDVGSLIQSTEDSVHRWTLQFMGEHLRYKLVVSLRQDDDQYFVLDYALYGLLGHVWERVEIPRYDTVVPFEAGVNDIKIKQHVADLELSYLPAYLVVGGLFK